MAYRRYTPMQGYQAFSGKNSFVYDVLNTPEWLDVYIKSKPHPCRCPVCGQLSDQILSTNLRTAQDLPYGGKPTLLHLNVYKYRCSNPNCKQHVFNEILEYVATNQLRTDRANLMILSLAFFLSNDAASIILEKMDLYISNDGIQRLIDAVHITEMPDPRVTGLPELAGQDLSAHRGAVYFDFNGRVHLISLIQHRDPYHILNRLNGNRVYKVLPRGNLLDYARRISKLIPSPEECKDSLTLFDKLLDILEMVFCGGIQEHMAPQYDSNSGSPPGKA